MSVDDEAPELVTVPKAEWEALNAEVRRYRRKEGDRVALERMMSGEKPGGPGHVTFTREQFAERLGVTE